MAAEQNEWFKKAEARLYAYPALVAKHRVDIIEYKLATPTSKATRYTVTSFCSGGEVIPEAERWVLKQEKIAQGILLLDQKLQDETNFISSLWLILKPEEQKLITLKYFEQKPRYYVTDKMGYSQPTCDKIRRRAIIKTAYLSNNLSHNEYEELLIG